MPITGKLGSINIGGAVAAVVDWQIDNNTEPVETTNMDDLGKQSFIDGIEGWSGSFTTLTLLNKRGSQAAATFNTGATPSASEPQYSGAILISNEPTTTTVAGRQEHAYTFSGQLTPAIAIA